VEGVDRKFVGQTDEVEIVSVTRCNSDAVLAVVTDA
jgi:hypothetical protein